MTATSESPAPEAQATVTARVARFARREAPWLLSLLTLGSLAIAQPILSTIASDATIFLGRASSKVAIVSFALLVTLGPALLLWCVELVARRISDSLRERLHAVFLVLLGWALFIQVLEIFDIDSSALISIGALVAAVGLAAAFVRYDGVRRWLAIMSPVAVYLLVSFLFLSPAWSFLRAGGAPTAAAPGEGADDPVVMLVFDELGTSALLDGQGQIDPDLFPNFARLAERSTWYRNATTVGPHTPLAVPAILTGQYPPSHEGDAAIASNYDGSLFSLLSESHDLNVHEPFTRFCTADISCAPHPATSTADELSTLLDLGQVLWEGAIDPGRDAEVPLNVAVRDDGDAAAYLDQFVASLDRPTGDRPTLDFVHVLLPHAPYRRLPSGAGYNAPAIPDGALSWQGPWEDEERTWAARQRHLLQAQYADARLGEVLDQLEASDRFDSSLIVVTADHGSGFVAGEPSRSLTERNAPHVAWVPLLVKAPDQEVGEVDDAAIENVDILPIISEALGVTVPWEVDGRPPGSRTDDDPAQLVPWPADDEPWADRVLEPSGDDVRVMLDREPLFREMLSTPTFGLLGEDPRWRPYQRGRYADLVGVRLDDLTVEDGAVDGRLTTDDRPVYAPGRAPSPVYVAGVVRGGEDRQEVAVVVNGTVAAMLPTHPADGQTFAGLVPEEVLRDGTNEITAYLVTGAAERPALAPLES